VIKTLSPAQMHPTNRPAYEDFRRYWAESHGPLYSRLRAVRRYVQHHTLPEAYGGDPEPTFPGASMFWYDDLDALFAPDPEDQAQLRAVAREDDRQLFDRLAGWPSHQKHAVIIAEERVIVDGPAAPSMVKLVVMALRIPGLTQQELFERWQGFHGPLVAKAPGIRRYVQNHAIPEANLRRQMTHDGWSELWFDDLDSLHRSIASPEWQAAREDGRTLFAQPYGIVIARELVQKEIDVVLPDPAGADLSDEQIRARLTQQGYAALLSDPAVPQRIRTAASQGQLHIWTDDHLVVIDEQGVLDARAG
jgi:uncharacterized protein (TIGR02118 family)